MSEITGGQSLKTSIFRGEGCFMTAKFLFGYGKNGLTYATVGHLYVQHGTNGGSNVGNVYLLIGISLRHVPTHEDAGNM